MGVNYFTPELLMSTFPLNVSVHVDVSTGSVSQGAWADQLPSGNSGSSFGVLINPYCSMPASPGTAWHGYRGRPGVPSFLIVRWTASTLCPFVSADPPPPCTLVPHTTTVDLLEANGTVIGVERADSCIMFDARSLRSAEC